MLLRGAQFHAFGVGARPAKLRERDRAREPGVAGFRLLTAGWPTEITIRPCAGIFPSGLPNWIGVPLSSFATDLSPSGQEPSCVVIFS